MADFDFGDITSRYLQQRFDPVNRLLNDPGQYLSNRVSEAAQPFTNPQQYAENRLGLTTSTNQAAIQAPQYDYRAPGAMTPQQMEGYVAPEQPAAPPVTRSMVGQGPVAPISQEDYNKNIAQAESGGNYDIGYHNREKSTAYGPFGITAPAWQDARKVNPNLPADITQATPEQMTQAQNAITQQNAGYLKNYGIEVTPNTLSAAHFLGAKGLADYLRDGTISPAAAKANGGEDNVRKIVQGRLGGRYVPASGGAQPKGAVQPPAAYDQGEFAGVDQAVAAQAAQPQTQFTEEQKTAAMNTELQRQQQYDDLNSKDPSRLLELTKSPDSAIASAAAGQLADIFKDKKLQAWAADHVENKLAQGEIPDIKRVKGEEGSYLKAYLFARLGLTELAQQEQQKISGTNVKFMPVNLPGGEQYSVKFDKDTNEVVSAKDSTGKLVTDSKKLGQIAAQAMTASQIGHAGATRVRDEAGKEWSVVPTSQGSIFYDTANVRGIPTGKTVPIQGGTDVELQGQLLAQKNKARLELLQKELQTRLEYIPAQEHNKVISKFNAENNTNFGLMAGPTGKPQVMERPAAAAPTTAAAPAAPMAPTAPTAPAPTAPAPTAAPVTQGVSPADIARQQKLSTEEGKAFVKYVSEDITPKADAGGQVARIRKQQINGPDGILANPELAGILQGQGGNFDEARNIVRDLVTGQFKDPEELSRRVASLNLTQRQKDVLNTQIGLNTQLNPLTLRANAGPGAISEAEHKLNAQANVDVTRVPLYTSLTLMSRSQFVNDMAAARAEFKNAHPELTTQTQFNSAWNSEKSRLEKEYESIYGERARYIAQYNKDGKNPGAVVDAFKHYPVPEYDSERKQWTYGGYSDRAKRPALGTFVK